MAPEGVGNVKVEELCEHLTGLRDDCMHEQSVSQSVDDRELTSREHRWAQSPDPLPQPVPRQAPQGQAQVYLELQHTLDTCPTVRDKFAGQLNEVRSKRASDAIPCPGLVRQSREGNSRVLQHIGAQSWVHLLPAAQVSSGLVQQVTVAGRKQVLHEDHRGTDGHQEEELTGPALVIIMCILGRAEVGQTQDSHHGLLPLPSLVLPGSWDCSVRISRPPETDNCTRQSTAWTRALRSISYDGIRSTVCYSGQSMCEQTEEWLSLASAAH